LSGEPEALKSWLALLATAQELLVGHRVVYVDLEDSASGVVERLRAMGVSDDLLRAHFAYVNPHGGLTPQARESLTATVQGAALVVIDAATEALAMQQLDPNSGAEVATWLALLPRWAASHGPAVLVLDHVVKNADNRGRFATGSQHKLAGVDGVALLIEPVAPGGRGMVGRSRLFLSKDRHGHVSKHARQTQAGKRWVGDLVVDSKSVPSFVDVVVFPPSEQEPVFLPTTVMARVSEALATAGEPLSETGVVTRVAGKAQTVRQALAALVDRGFVTWETGPRNAKLHRLVKPYPPLEDE
jgi:hypothetical protein